AAYRSETKLPCRDGAWGGVWGEAPGRGDSPEVGEGCLSGCWLEHDGVAEFLELPDEVALAGGVGVAPLEVVGAEYLVVAVAGEDVPDDHDHGVGDGEEGLALALLAEATLEPAVLGGQVAFVGVGRRPGRFDQSAAEGDVAFGGPTGLPLSC